MWLSDDVYCLRNYYWGNFLRAQDAAVNNEYIVDTQTECGPWEKWTVEILAEPLYVEITYDTDKAALTELEPLAVATQVLNNKNSSID